MKLPLVVHKLGKEAFQANQEVEISVENARLSDLKISLFGPADQETGVRITEEPVGETGSKISLSPPWELTPGRYKLTITDSSGKVVEQSFTWGTLAINADKNIYSPNETIKLSFTVLDKNGEIACNAELHLAIVSEKAGVAEELSTSQGTIQTNPECRARDVSDRPDYEATYKVGGEGNYHLTLTATTEKGTTTVTDSFTVKTSVPFEIRREAPTRIYPPSPYTVRTLVKANQDFEGTVEETVPTGFSLLPSSDNPYTATETVTLPTRLNPVPNSSVPSLSIPFSGQPQISLRFGEVYSDANLVENVLNKFGLVGHDGVDFAMSVGTTVTAADDGEVVKAGEGPYGTTVVLHHSWGISYYGHLSSVAVAEGQTVKKGGQIGLSGDSGESTGPHLHFALEPAVGTAPAGFNGRVDPLPHLGLGNNFQGVATISQTTIRWQVALKKGQEIVLPYSFTAPNISPALYLLGPLKFFQLDKLDQSPIFSESRPWQIAADATSGSAFIDHVKKESLRKIRTVELSELGNSSQDFTSEELPEFSFGLTSAKFTRLLRNPKELDSVIRKLKHAERSDVEDPVTEATINFSTKHLLIAPRVLNDFRPGRYRLSIQVPSTEGPVNLEQDFTWGVLALNTNKSVYKPNETVKLGMAILDDYGRTKCLNSQDVFDRGRLWLTITSPSGSKEELSTDNGKIYDSGKCDVHSVTNEADFQANYQTSEVGTYQMHLEGENQNGRRSIDDIFKVDSVIPFEVERLSLPTRIYPSAGYTNTLTVLANQDFTGEIREGVPDSFQISQITPIPKMATSAGGTRSISWSVSLKKGEVITLSYTFDAPNVSPEFYLLGPLKFFQLDKFNKLDQFPLFSEIRSWQIAADATKTWDGGCTGQSNTLWSCANNWNNNTLPASTDDLVFDATASDPNGWDTLAGSTYNSVTYNSTYTGTSTFTCPSLDSVCRITGALVWNSGTGGTLTFAAATQINVGGNLTMTSIQTFTPNTSTVLMTGTANLNSFKTFNTLIINGVNTTVSVVTNSPTVSGTLTIGGSLDGDNDTLSIGSGLTVTSGTAGTVTIHGSGIDTISGAGTLVVQNSNLSTNGTLSSIVRFDATSGDINMPARTYGGDVEFYSSSNTSARNVVMLSITIQSLSGNLLGRAEGTQNITLTGVTNNPTVNVTGNIDFTGAGSGSESIVTGTGTWTVSGSVDFTGGTFTATTNNLFKMNGTSKNLTSVSQSFYDFEVSGGSINPQDTMFVYNNLTVSSGTLAMGANSLAVGSSSANSGSIKVASGATISQSASGTTSVVSSASGANCIGANSTNCATGTAGTIGFYNLTIGNGSTTFTTTINGGVAPTVTVGNTLNITTNATLGANGTLNVAGNWTKTGGFTANSSSVNLNGAGSSTQTLSGSTTFYDLSTTTTSARTLTFTASTTQTVTHSLTFTGAASNLLTLQSSSSPTVWNINTTGATTSLSYLTVSDSTSTVCINASSSSGTNTTYWDFVGGNCGSGPTNDQLLRHGEWFNSSGVRQPFTF